MKYVPFCLMKPGVPPADFAITEAVTVGAVLSTRTVPEVGSEVLRVGEVVMTSRPSHHLDKKPESESGPAAVVDAPSLAKEGEVQALATGAPDWRWTARLAVFAPEAVSESVQVTLIDAEFCSVFRMGAVTVTVGAVLSTRTVPEV